VLRNRIVDGTLKPGDRLPSESAIEADFGVSRITAKRALDELAGENLVTRARGKGTVVARSAASSIRGDFSQLMENLIEIDTKTKVKVVNFSYGSASAQVLEALHLDPDAVVQRAERIRIQGRTPFSHIVTYVPEDIGRSFGPEDLSTRPILSLIEEAGVDIAEAQQSLSAVLADGEIATALAVPPGSPLLKVVRVVAARDGRPVQFIEILYRQDRYHFNMTLARVAGDNNTRIWKSHNSTAVD
jgi:GntR family transcriptional regulator